MKIEQRKIHHGNDYAVFHVPVIAKMVYMEQRLYSTDDDAYFVILVDRHRFESVWFKCGSTVVPELARGNENNWRNDYKFHYAEQAFNIGIENPVPLAKLKANDSYPSISFIDGITRTICLMANGAKYFPVFTYDRNSAINLHNYIGMKNSKVYSNNDLMAYLNK